MHFLCLHLFSFFDAHDSATSFPLSKHTEGGDTAPAFWGLGVYLQFTWEVSLSPSPVEFSSHYHFHKLSRSWLLDVCRHSCLLQAACLRDFPSLLFGSQGAPPSLLHVFLLLLRIIRFFPWVGVSLSRGAILIWPRLVCGSTTCCLAHFVVCVFPSRLGTAIWQWRRSPPGFSI
jgi:hypothetical protein